MTQDNALDIIPTTPRAVALTLNAYGFRQTPDGLWSDGTVVPVTHQEALAIVHAVALARSGEPTLPVRVVFWITVMWGLLMFVLGIIMLGGGAP